jgi:hypothetical protein
VRVLLPVLSLVLALGARAPRAAACGQDDAPPPATVEGPLANDAFRATHPEAQRELFAGDRSLRRARAGGAAAPSELSAAFDAWRRALDLSEAGDAVELDEPETRGVFPDPDHTHARRTEGVAAGVLRRLSTLAADERAGWSARFAASAAEALDAAAGRARPLARLERGYPLTRAAALAALRLADLAIEEARPAAASVWLARAERHLAGPPDEVWRAQLAGRRAALAGPPAARAAWEAADAFEVQRVERLERLSGAGGGGRSAPLGRSLEPGLAFLDDGALVVQTARAVFWLSALATRQDVGGPVQPSPLAPLLGVRRVRPYVPPSTGGWPLLPASDGHDVVVVVDRGQPGRLVRDLPLAASGNHLARLVPQPGGAMQVAWHLSADGLVRGAERVPCEEVLGPGVWEFHPGPVVVDDKVLVVARSLAEPEPEFTGRADQVVLFALELESGRRAWQRFLTKASDLRVELGGRLGTLHEVPTAGMPLAVHAGHVFVGTNLGLAFAYDVAEGRQAWSFRYRRRAADEEGWPGSRRPVCAGAAAWFAPFDSDFLYALPAGPQLGGGPFLRRAPLPIAGDADLVAASPDEVLLLGRDGRHAALRSRAPDGAAGSSLFLGAEERFVGRALAGPTRVLAATSESLLVFDRERELLLLDATALTDAGAGCGGTVHARADQVFIVGADTLWILRAR